MLVRHHTYRLNCITSRNCFIPIELAVKALKGVMKVVPDYEGGKIMVTYDLEKVRSEQIEEMVKLAGYPVRMNLWQKIRLGLIHFNEQNTVDNLKARPPECCSNPRHLK